MTSWTFPDLSPVSITSPPWITQLGFRTAPPPDRSGISVPGSLLSVSTSRAVCSVDDSSSLLGSFLSARKWVSLTR